MRREQTLQRGRAAHIGIAGCSRIGTFSFSNVFQLRSAPQGWLVYQPFGLRTMLQIQPRGKTFGVAGAVGGADFAVRDRDIGFHARRGGG